MKAINFKISTKKSFFSFYFLNKITLAILLSGQVFSSFTFAYSLSQTEFEIQFTSINKLKDVYESKCQNGVPNLSSPWLNVSIDECLVAIKLEFTDSEWKKIENYAQQIIEKNLSATQINFYKNLFKNKNINQILVAEVADSLNYQYSNASIGMSILILPIYALTVSVIIYYAGSEDRENEKKYKEKAELDNFSSRIKQCENDRNLSIPDNSPNKEASKIANAKLCLDQVKLEFDLKFFKSINN